MLDMAKKIIERKKGKAGKIVKKIVLGFVVLVVCAIILFPLVWMFPAAFKTKREIWQIPNTWWPNTFVGDNFSKIMNLDLNGYNFLSSLLWTFLVSTIAVVLSLLVNMLAAFSFATMEFRGKKFLWVYFIITMCIPGITILLTSLRVVYFLHLTDTIWVLILPGLVSAYNIFFFRQFFYSIPLSLEEAATIDGCSRWKIFWKIFFPMSSTPMVIIGVGVFMGYWNSFIWPTLTIINNTKIAQIMQVIRILNTSTYAGQNYSIIIAATELAILIPLALFAIFQKKIIAGIAISGLK
jgi:multiple sugar transport system permease protein